MVVFVVPGIYPITEAGRASFDFPTTPIPADVVCFTVLFPGPIVLAVFGIVPTFGLVSPDGKLSVIFCGAATVAAFDGLGL